MFTTKQMSQIFPMLLAQVKAGIISENLLSKVK